MSKEIEGSGSTSVSSPPFFRVVLTFLPFEQARMAASMLANGF